MPTPVAHALAGFSLFRVSLTPGSPSTALRPLWLGWILACAAAPDLDHLVSWLWIGDRMALHRQTSHSLLAVVIAAALGALFFHRAVGACRAGLVSLLATGSHVALDLLTGARLGAHPAYGAALLAPFEAEKYHLPFSLIPGLQGVLTLHNLYVVMAELAVFGTIALLVARRWPQPVDGGARC
jgi:membrane-bound metal-dependent hydrolase YbcI (DUF457 family)